MNDKYISDRDSKNRLIKAKIYQKDYRNTFFQNYKNFYNRHWREAYFATHVQHVVVSLIL